MKTIIIKSVGKNNGWYNITTSTGKIVGVEIAKNPNLANVLEEATEGQEIKMFITDAKGKFYGNETERKGNSYGKGKENDYGVITMLACQRDAITYYHRRLQSGKDDVFELADELFKRAMEKSTLNKS